MTSTSTLVSEASSIPTAPGRKPVLGHALEFMRRPVPFLKSLRHHGSVVRIYFGKTPVYALTSSSAAQIALVTKGDSFGRDKFNERMARLIGEGMSTTVDPSLHKRQRRIIQPSLHHQRVGAYVSSISDVIAEASRDWRDGQKLDWAGDMFHVAVSVMARTLVAGELGKPLRDEIDRSFLSFLHSVLARMQSNVSFKQKLPTRANKRFAEEQARLLKAIDDAIVAYQEDGNDHHDLLSMLISAIDEQTGEPMPPDRLRDEVIGLMVAAVDSLAISLTWLFFEIGRNPVIEGRVMRELTEVLGDQPLEHQRFAELSYLNRVITEVLRLHNPAIAVLRRCTADTEIDGHLMTAGTRVLISPYAMGHDPEHYPAPEKFDPDRWVPGNTIPRSAYLPFLSGRYKCAGEALAWSTLMVAAAQLLPQWRIVPCPDKPVREVFQGSYIQASHMPMRLERRAHN